MKPITTDIDSGNISFYDAIASRNLLDEFAKKAGLDSGVDIEKLSSLHWIDKTFCDDLILIVGPGAGRDLELLLPSFPNILAVEASGKFFRRLLGRYRSEASVKLIHDSIINLSNHIPAATRFRSIFWLWCGICDCDKGSQSAVVAMLARWLMPQGMLFVDVPIDTNATLQKGRVHYIDSVDKMPVPRYAGYVPSPLELRAYGSDAGITTVYAPYMTTTWRRRRLWGYCHQLPDGAETCADLDTLKDIGWIPQIHKEIKHPFCFSILLVSDSDRELDWFLVAGFTTITLLTTKADLARRLSAKFTGLVMPRVTVIHSDVAAYCRTSTALFTYIYYLSMQVFLEEESNTFDLIKLIMEHVAIERGLFVFAASPDALEMLMGKYDFRSSRLTLFSEKYASSAIRPHTLNAVFHHQRKQAPLTPAMRRSVFDEARVNYMKNRQDASVSKAGCVSGDASWDDSLPPSPNTAAHQLVFG